MNTKLISSARMDRGRLQFHNYFQTYIGEATRVNLLSQEEVLNIQHQLIRLLEIQIQRYTRFESSSVKVETAEQLMKSILYALDFKFKGLKGEIEEGVQVLKAQDVETIFKEAVILLKEEVRKSKGYYEKVVQNRLHVDNYAYNDTIDHGFNDFFAYYEAEFNAQANGCDIDYPLCVDEMKEEGIEYVLHYLKKLYYENVFCRYFKEEGINKLLESVHSHQKELLINIFEIVLVNSIGRLLNNKDLTALSLSEWDCSDLQSKLENIKGIQTLVETAANEIITSFKIQGFLKQYIFKALPSIISRMQAGVMNHSLNQVFVSSKELTTGIAPLYFKDGESLSDDAFKEVIEEVCCCGSIMEKLAIFKKRIHSLKDLMDFLEAECLYGKEYSALYRSLSELELALLMSRMALEDEQSFQMRLQELKAKTMLLRPWESELMYFLAHKDLAVRQKLWLVVANIK